MAQTSSMNLKQLLSSPLIIAVVIGGLLYIAGQYVASEPQRIEQEVEANRSITVEGTGSVEARPDIARITLGVQIEPQDTAEQALDMLSERENRVVERVQSLGVNEEDVQTKNFSVNPQYDFQDGERQLRGYAASEQIEVRIRDLDSIGEIISQTTAEGVNQVGGITFESEDEETLVTQAQEAAIADARTKAEQLTDALGVRLGDVKSFSSTQDQPSTPPFQLEAQGEGRGGAPSVPRGTNEITARVSVTYSLE